MYESLLKAYGQAVDRELVAVGISIVNRKFDVRLRARTSTENGWSEFDENISFEVDTSVKQNAVNYPPMRELLIKALDFLVKNGVIDPYEIGTPTEGMIERVMEHLQWAFADLTNILIQGPPGMTITREIVYTCAQKTLDTLRLLNKTRK